MAEKAYHIRKGRSTDAAQLAEFAERVFLEVFGPDNDPQQMEAHLAVNYSPTRQAAEIEDPNVITLIAESSGTICGYAQIRRGHSPQQIQNDNTLELWRFYVDAPWRGRGLAQDLIADVFKSAHIFGGRSLWLSVWEKNPRAIAFYKKSGFQQAGKLDFYLGSERQTDLLLVAKISN